MSHRRYPIRVVRATFSGPAPRPHPLALSGVETPVNLAFVEAPSALESPMEFSKRVLIVDDEPNVVGVLPEFFARFQHGHTYDVVPASSATEALDILPRRVSISFCSTWSFQGSAPVGSRVSTC